jgi:hypothetical protein
MLLELRREPRCTGHRELEALDKVSYRYPHAADARTEKSGAGVDRCVARGAARLRAGPAGAERRGQDHADLAPVGRARGAIGRDPHRRPAAATGARQGAHAHRGRAAGPGVLSDAHGGREPRMLRRGQRAFGRAQASSASSLHALLAAGVVRGCARRPAVGWPQAPAQPGDRLAARTRADAVRRAHRGRRSAVARVHPRCHQEPGESKARR